MKTLLLAAIAALMLSAGVANAQSYSYSYSRAPAHSQTGGQYGLDGGGG